MLLKNSEYRSYPAINFSSIARLEISPKVYNEQAESSEEREAFIFGGLVDCLLTTPEKFDDDYGVPILSPPTGQMGIFIGYLLKENITENNKKEVLKAAYDYAGFKRDSLTTVLDRFKEYAGYYEEAVKLKGKIIVSFETYTKAAKIAQEIKEAYPEFFNPKEGVEVLWQTPVLFRFLGREFKALVDLLYIDHNKKIVKPIDIKTTGKSIYQFKMSFFQYRYYIQAAIYFRAVKEYIRKDRELKGYKIHGFRFLVAEKESFNKPMMFDVSCWLKTITFGGEYGGTKFKGLTGLLNTLKWHEEHNLWDYPKEAYQEGGVELKL